MMLIFQSALARFWCSRNCQHVVRSCVPEGDSTASDATCLKVTTQLQTLRAWRWQHSFRSYVPEGDSTTSDVACL